MLKDDSLLKLLGSVIVDVWMKYQKWTHVLFQMLHNTCLPGVCDLHCTLLGIVAEMNSRISVIVSSSGRCRYSAFCHEYLGVSGVTSTIIMRKMSNTMHVWHIYVYIYWLPLDGSGMQEKWQRTTDLHASNWTENLWHVGEPAQERQFSC